MLKSKHHKHEKFGTLLGIAPGNVPVYSSDYETMDESNFDTRESLRNYVDETYTGYKWQCVEFARRWCYLTRGYVFDDISMAYDIFNLTHVKDVKNNTTLPLKSFKNGAKRLPEVGSLLIWHDTGFFEITGHVAVITDVGDGHVDIVEQNVDQHIWPKGQNYSRRLSAKRDEFGGYWIACNQSGGEIIGWVMQTDDPRDSEIIPVIDNKLFNIKSDRINTHKDEHKGWLNVANADEEHYVRVNGYKLANEIENHDLYFYMSKTAQQEIVRATNELHAMFMHATHLVLKHDELFDKFHIPRALWPKIQNSWKNRKNENITGRFDFCVTENGIKLYEYNIDTSSCYLETAKIQGKWAEYYGCNLGKDPGEKLAPRLVKCWTDSEADGILHIFTDARDQEEIYHSNFMKSLIEDAGIYTKVITDLSQLVINDKNQIIDNDGNIVRWIWKTWSWETVLNQIRSDMDKMHSREPNLANVLLNDNTLIYEPLWAVVTSNKALLPIMWELYPNNKYLLNSQFTVTDELRQSGYVAKPIAGRCGENIELFDEQNDMMEQTKGKFAYQDNIYQELCRLPVVDGLHVQISAFTVDGSYAASCARAEKNKIITKGSNIIPLRVVEDEIF